MSESTYTMVTDGKEAKAPILHDIISNGYEIKLGAEISKSPVLGTTRGDSVFVCLKEVGPKQQMIAPAAATAAPGKGTMSPRFPGSAF